MTEWNGAILLDYGTYGFLRKMDRADYEMSEISVFPNFA